jgi:acid phosphatase (class A)
MTTGQSHTRIFKLFFILALLFALGACAPAYVWKTPTGLEGVHYLDPVRAQFTNFPAPPLHDSDIDKADLKTLREWQEKRSSVECALAGAESIDNFESLFGKISPFGKPTPPEVAAFFERVHSDLEHSVGAVKKRFRRPRPFSRNLGLEPCIGLVGGYSYPSGHATNARLFALILSDLLPEQKEVFIARAGRAALNRVIGAVHHPSDIEAGKRLAEEIYSELIKNHSFRSDAQNLRKYITPPRAD